MIASTSAKGNLSKGKEHVSGCHLLRLCVEKEKSCNSGQ